MVQSLCLTEALQRLYHPSFLWTARTSETCISISFISGTPHLHSSVVRGGFCLVHIYSFRDAVPLAAHTISSLEYTTLALAKVWTIKAKLPNSQTMLMLHEKTVEERGGYGQYVLFFGPERASGKSFVACFVLGLSIQSCHSSCYLLGRLAERSSGQVWWQAGLLRSFSSRSWY